MPSSSPNTLVYLRWERLSLNAYTCSLKSSSSPSTLNFSNPIELLTKDEFQHGWRCCATPFFLPANSLEDRKILWAFTAQKGNEYEPWSYSQNSHPVGWQRGLWWSFVLQIRKHLAYAGRCFKPLRRYPEPPEDECADLVGSLLPSSMAQIDDLVYLHQAPIGADIENPDSEKTYILSSVQFAKQATTDVWKPQGTTEDLKKLGSGTPPGKPASRMLHVSPHMKNDYVHFIDIQRPENMDAVNYTDIGTGMEGVPRPWVQIHQMAKSDFILGPSRSAPWQTFELQIPEAIILNWPYLFTCRNANKVPIPVVTANGKDGFRLWLISDYWDRVRFPDKTDPKYTIFGLYINLRPDGSIDSYSKTPAFSGGYWIEIGQTEYTNLSAAAFDYGNPGVMDHLLLMMESENGPLSLSVPIRRDGTLGTERAEDRLFNGGRKEPHLNDIRSSLSLQKMEVSGVDFNRTVRFQGNGLVLVPNDFL